MRNLWLEVLKWEGWIVACGKLILSIQMTYLVAFLQSSLVTLLNFHLLVTLHYTHTSQVIDVLHLLQKATMCSSHSTNQSLSALSIIRLDTVLSRWHSEMLCSDFKLIQAMKRTMQISQHVSGITSALKNVIAMMMSYTSCQ